MKPAAFLSLHPLLVSAFGASFGLALLFGFSIPAFFKFLAIPEHPFLLDR
jgi:hypothetical protein